MRLSVRRAAAPVLALALLALGCGREREDDEGDAVGGPSPVQTPAATPQPSATPTPAASPTPAATPTPGAGSVAYVQDVKPILDTSCVRCHASLATYSGALRYVTPGSADSPLVVVTRSNGAMYGYLGSDASARSELIRRWVVESGAAESR